VRRGGGSWREGPGWRCCVGWWKGEEHGARVMPEWFDMLVVVLGWACMMREGCWMALHFTSVGRLGADDAPMGRPGEGIHVSLN
jgi:hypothetical protein